MNNVDYTEKKINESITIDGNTKKKMWKNVAWSKCFVDMVTGKQVIPQPSIALNRHGIYDTHLTEKCSKIEFAV